MVQKKRWLFTAMVLGLVLAAAGCGGESGEDDRAGMPVWEGSEGILLAQGDRLYLRERKEYTLADPTEYTRRQLYADAWGGKFYILAQYVTETEAGGEQNQYVMNVFDGATGQLEPQSFAPEFSEEKYSIFSMEVQSPQQLSFRLRDYQNEEDEILVETDIMGKTTRREVPFPEESEYPWNPENFIGVGNRIYDNSDGSAILSQWNDQELTATLYWYDSENKSRRIIGELEYNPDTLYLDQSRMLYYVGGGSLVRRDLEEGTENIIMSMKGMQPSSFAYTSLLPGSGGELLFCVFLPNEGKLEVYHLSNQKSEPEDEIRMVHLWDDTRGDATALAVEYSLAHPECPIMVEQAQGDVEDFKSQIMMELAAGKGPELLWVSSGDLETLADKGILMDMRELIAEDVMEQLYPCVIAAGSVNGTMLALAPQFEISFLMAPDQVWEKNSWSLSEFLDLAESRDDWGKMVSFSSSALPPISCLFQMIPNPEETPFLDMEQKKAHFDHQDFFRAMELCKKYGAKEGEQDLSYQEKWDMMKKGECISELVYLYSGLIGYSSAMAEYRDVCHLVGYPGSNGKGHIECIDGFLVVNAKAEHLEEIRDYIAMLLSYENQLSLNACWARRDVTENCVKEIILGIGGEAGQVKINDRISYSNSNIVLKPDGSSYLEEYLDLLENCTANPGWPEQIRQIVVDELLPYFYEDRSAKEAVTNIQNRVQLYLDE